MNGVELLRRLITGQPHSPAETRIETFARLASALPQASSRPVGGCNNRVAKVISKGISCASMGSLMLGTRNFFPILKHKIQA